MDKFISKKRSNDVDHSAVVTVGSESTSERKAKKSHLHCDSYLKIGFTWVVKKHNLYTTLSYL